ncbi:hypothetical protein TNCT_486761 [Trichonephila clavata]|uniref:Uncharacterized protein n=1 Tax=Trichonephila clavata TaxID=2740835 RepID=A0A8X6LCA5_TRICU|nr:hypothetical protein TNCT_486761 [Trichonephila clavata]
MEDEPDLVSFIRRIVPEEVHRVIDQTLEPILYSDPYTQIQLLEEMVQGGRTGSGTSFNKPCRNSTTTNICSCNQEIKSSCIEITNTAKKN